MGLCERCFDRWSSQQTGSRQFLDRQALRQVVSGVIWLAAEERLVSEDSPDNGESTDHFREEGTWITMCGQSIAEMRVDSGIGEIDGVAFALLQASRTDLMHAVGELLDRNAPRRSIDRAFRRYRINPVFIREMSANKSFHEAIAATMPRLAPNKVFKFEPLRVLYMKRFRRKTKRFARPKVPIEETKTLLTRCPRCSGLAIPTGEYHKVPYSMQVEAKLSIAPLMARKEWRYEAEFRCRKCGHVFGKSDH